MTGTGSLFRRTSRHTGKPLPGWWIQYSLRGVQTRQSARTTNRAEALRKLKAKLGQVAAGTAPDRDRRQATVRTLLAALVAKYRDEGRGSLANVESHARMLNEAIGDRLAIDLTTPDLLKLVSEWQRKKNTPATCNRRIAVLRLAYNLGDVVVDPARLRFAKAMMKEKSPLARFIDREAFTKIHTHLPADLKDLFEVAYILGVRRTQLAGTTWSDLDRAAWTFTWQADATKQARPHVIALAGRALEIIRARFKDRRLDCPFVFHRNGKRIVEVRKAWTVANRAAGFPVGRKQGGFEWRATRHSAFTNLVNAGVPIHEAMLISGHSTMSVVRRYSIGTAPQQRKALEAVTTAR